MPGETTKRIFDVALAVFVLLVLSPVLGVCALAVRLLDGSPVLFRHERVGRHGRRFSLLKLRTMRPGAGQQITVAGDPLVTSLGRFLRRLKLDELPQVWNVLRVEMSVFGPRPEVQEYVAIYYHGYLSAWRLCTDSHCWS